MASIYTNVNKVAMNRKQLRRQARELGLAYDQSITTAALKAAIEAV